MVCSPVSSQSAKPAITLDEYLNTIDISSARLSPDGASAVIATDQPDWKDSIYRHDLWVWNAQSGLRSLTHSASEEDGQWSPDSKWIAFLSDRSLLGDDASSDAEPGTDATKPRRVWIIPAAGGEALPLYSEKLDVHAFAWSADSSAVYFSAQEPLDHDEAESRATEWQDVIRWREQNRGDLLVKIEIAPAIADALAAPLPNGSAAAKTAKGRADTIPAPTLPSAAKVLTKSQLAIDEIAVAPNGKTLAFLTGPVHRRTENPADFEIYLVSSSGGESRQLTHNQALESRIAWAPDSHWLHFLVAAAAGSLDGPYRDVQGRLYRIDTESGKVDRLGSSFDGSFDQFALLPDGHEIALGLKGVETQLYLVEGGNTTKLPGAAGTYAGLESTPKSNTILIRHSTVNDPTQVYLATDPMHPDQLKQLTNFNSIFHDRAQPEWQPYTWKADDGRTVEGVLIFPPGKKNAKHLRMFTLIHGGPADADANRFGADWYDWATFAADHGWLVFRPNYRGSSGYGDDFMLEIEPHLVSKPGSRHSCRSRRAGQGRLRRSRSSGHRRLQLRRLHDQLAHHPDHALQIPPSPAPARWSTRPTGATTTKPGTTPGTSAASRGRIPDLYQSEAALFRFDKVKTPTHLVQGGADIRVSYLEGETMERALQALGIPHTFLVFPGEGHSLDKNPWHGYIKLREELKWIEKYDSK